MPDFPNRRRPVHGINWSVDSVIVFITACTKGRIPWLANEDVHRAILDTWKEANHWLVGRYVVMPDHIHLFATPTAIAPSLETWIKFWKSRFWQYFKKARTKWPPAYQWQAEHWDTRLRSSKSYESKWEYVRRNPVRHGLVEHAENWPFQGELNVISGGFLG